MSHKEDNNQDGRFAAMHTSKLFKKIGSDKHKVKLDPRFQGVLTEDKFRVEPGQVDKYGRKKKGGKASTKQAEKELSQFYEIDHEDDNDDANVEETEEIEPKLSKQVSTKQSKSSQGKSNKESNDNNDSSNAKETVESRLDFLNRFARGDYEGDSSSDEEDDEEEEDDDNSTSSETADEDDEEVEVEEDNRFRMRRGPMAIDEDYGDEEDDDEEEEDEAEQAEDCEATNRIALQNCDWDNIKAVDLQCVLCACVSYYVRMCAHKTMCLCDCFAVSSCSPSAPPAATSNELQSTCRTSARSEWKRRASTARSGSGTSPLSHTQRTSRRLLIKTRALIRETLCGKRVMWELCLMRMMTVRTWTSSTSTHPPPLQTTQLTMKQPRKKFKMSSSANTN
jgi:hypothetical protein